MKDLEAWNKFEDGLKDVTSMEEALAWVKQNQAIVEKLTIRSMIRKFKEDIAWVKKNQKIVEKLTIRAMIRKFNDDISKSNKAWRN